VAETDAAVFDKAWGEWKAPGDAERHIGTHAEDRRVLHAILDRCIARGPAGNLRVLEAGCGTAVDSILLARRHGGIEVTAVDYSDGGLAVARRVAESAGVTLKFEKADVRSLPYPDGSFGLVFSQGLMEHFREPGVVMAEEARVTARGGWVVVDVPQVFNVYTLIKTVRRWHGRWPWGWETQYSRGRLARLGRKAGLEPVEFRGYGYWGGKFDLLAALSRVMPKGAWGRFESVFGSRLLMNLVGVFRKP